MDWVQHYNNSPQNYADKVRAVSIRNEMSLHTRNLPDVGTIMLVLETAVHLGILIRPHELDNADD